MMIVLYLLIYLLLNAFIGWNIFLFTSFVFPTISVTLGWIIFWLVAFSYVIGRVPAFRGPVGRLCKVVGSYYFAILEFAVIVLPIADGIGWILIHSGILERRVILTIGYSVLFFLLAFLLRGSWNAWSPITRRYEIQIDKQAPPFSLVRIAIASDIHLGNLVGKRHLKKMVKAINSLQPDLILLPGDVIDDDIEPFIRNKMSLVMRELHAAHGVFAVLGNHEYYGGHIEEYVKQMRDIGIQVLRDETVLIMNALYIVGRKDKTAETAISDQRESVATLLKDVDCKRPVIMMDHQPTQFDLALAAGVDVLLSGHTHRGQMAPNHWITKRLFELDWGYMQKNTLHVIVSSGYGTWGPPIRTASRSEIIELVIKFKQA